MGRLGLPSKSFGPMRYNDCIIYYCYHLVELTFVKWSTGCQVVSHGSVTDLKRN